MPQGLGVQWLMLGTFKCSTLLFDISMPINEFFSENQGVKVYQDNAKISEGRCNNLMQRVLLGYYSVRYSPSLSIL